MSQESRSHCGSPLWLLKSVQVLSTHRLSCEHSSGERRFSNTQAALNRLQHFHQRDTNPSNLFRSWNRFVLIGQPLQFHHSLGDCECHRPIEVDIVARQVVWGERI
jgi:hypothetical protein